MGSRKKNKKKVSKKKTVKKTVKKATKKVVAKKKKAVKKVKKLKKEVKTEVQDALPGMEADTDCEAASELVDDAEVETVSDNEDFGMFDEESDEDFY